MTLPASLGKEGGFGPYPGYWSELCLLHNWPPGWVPSGGDWGSSAAMSANATEARERQIETTGNTGTKPMSKAARHRADTVAAPAQLVPERRGRA